VRDQGGSLDCGDNGDDEDGDLHGW
jgi:hypothetical protein